LHTRAQQEWQRGRFFGEFAIERRTWDTVDSKSTNLD
jgi:hypothetical protein